MSTSVPPPMQPHPSPPQPAMRWWHAARWLPAQCPFCHAWPVWQSPGGICNACLSRAQRPQPRCLRCALPLLLPTAPCSACAAVPSPLQVCITAVDYGYPWHRAIEAFKFQQQPAWARAMAQLLWLRPGCRTLLEQADWIIPVPLSSVRLRERGYNQAWELAKALTTLSGQSHAGMPHAVTRQHTQESQARQTRQQRLRRMQGVFSVAPSDATFWAGRHVVLVDDVMTTGATLFALANVVYAAGAQSVSAISFARTPPPEWD